ncbi:hypothetical protein D9756_001027 [Leucocoprinus leucothites]|uniref:GED domain-containing protein n=1 Tax=Leucocoprinus leucothites TaxID=201217 RepID=A0A8H5LNZ6_9AGAR|nr:hypothetical protein D9756_001027 [Leucoagaricus leucothites]
MSTISTSTPLSSSVKNFKGVPVLYGIAGVLSGLAEISLTGIRANDLTKLLRTDDMEPALEIIADVHVYFQVTYKRFSDNVPAAVDQGLVHGFERNVLPLMKRAGAQLT